MDMLTTVRGPCNRSLIQVGYELVAVNGDALKELTDATFRPMGQERALGLTTRECFEFLCSLQGPPEGETCPSGSWLKLW